MPKHTKRAKRTTPTTHTKGQRKHKHTRTARKPITTRKRQPGYHATNLAGGTIGGNESKVGKASSYSSGTTKQMKAGVIYDPNMEKTTSRKIKNAYHSFKQSAGETFGKARRKTLDYLAEKRKSFRNPGNSLKIWASSLPNRVKRIPGSLKNLGSSFMEKVRSMRRSGSASVSPVSTVVSGPGRFNPGTGVFAEMPSAVKQEPQKLNVNPAQEAKEAERVRAIQESNRAQEVYKELTRIQKMQNEATSEDKYNILARLYTKYNLEMPGSNRYESAKAHSGKMKALAIAIVEERNKQVSGPQVVTSQ